MTISTMQYTCKVVIVLHFMHILFSFSLDAHLAAMTAFSHVPSSSSCSFMAGGNQYALGPPTGIKRESTKITKPLLKTNKAKP